MTQSGLDRANQLAANVGSNANTQSSLKQDFVPGSRLNLNPSQKDEYETKYYDASNFTRKSYGGNTQYKYYNSAA